MRMAYNGVTIVVDDKTIDKMHAFYSDQIVHTNDLYTIFMVKLEGVVIKAYRNKKLHNYKVYFTGDNALKEAQIWDIDAKLIQNEPKEQITWIYLEDQIGSDEVGVGDFFAPTIVVAAYVKKDQIEEIRELGVKDSKRLSDDKIRIIAPKLMNLVKYEKLIMSNHKLLEMLSKGSNKLGLEAFMHNTCQMRLINKYNLKCKVFVDEFLGEHGYRSYLTNTDTPNDITFKTKGESYYPSIAVASIIARYILLIYMDDLNDRYGVKFPLGAGENVDFFSVDFVKNNSLEDLQNIAKINFINYQNLLEKLSNE